MDTTPKPETVYDTFAAVDMRVGRVVDVQPFPRARNPAYKVEVDLGPLGRRWSSAQVTSYKAEELLGSLVVVVLNLPPRNIAGFKSEVLILGARNEAGDVMVLTPRSDVTPGEQVF